MIRLYAGQILAGMAVLFAVVGTLGWWAYAVTERSNQVGLIWFAFGCLGAIGALTCGALAYAYWVPKWERDEKRTGHIPGEERER